jgi:hypothetical protein
MAEQGSRDNPELLSRLMDAGLPDEDAWRPEELGEILRRQLAVPLSVDLEPLDPSVPGLLEAAGAGGATLRTFEDLFYHPSPPLRLLELAKEFGKSNLRSPPRLLPRDVAMVLYVTSIVVALRRCRARISQLTPETLRHRVTWILQQPWVDARLRALVSQELPPSVGH